MPRPAIPTDPLLPALAPARVPLAGALRQLRRLAVSVLGTTVLMVGVALIVLPGPAFVVIPAGLGILALEFFWARRLLVRVRRWVRGAAARVRRREPLPNGATPTCLE